eukprot:TRINITY_DN1265_c0_g2_i2.p1 TRINITY_DN1265_c0_g2~~TRINITY_DN1265_c0_g2_i2.p1  ORF type:complete len:285 (-),score=22.15 TRINITY_DN1265_c0_g2_i2:221-1075(-)
MPLTARKPSQHLVDLVGALAGTWRGYVAMCRCPAHDDSSPSLSIRQGDNGILVTCFAGCAREDVLRELRRIRPDRHFSAPDPLRVPGRANIDRIWEQGIAISGTLAERYLVHRHLEPSAGDIRFHPRCPYLPKPQTVFEPALLVAVRERRTLVALQRIFLRPDGCGYIRKVMLGEPRSGVWLGRAGGTTLAIAEGFETAAAFSQLHDLPCGASLGARRLDLLTIAPGVTTLLLAEDNDAEGRRAAARACTRYKRPGLSIRRSPPPAPFKDWAEVLDAKFAQIAS